MTLAEVRLWGTTIGAVALGEGRTHAVFEYAPSFVGSGVEVSPLVMPLANGPYLFPTLPHPTFHGLPGLLADSLPDRYGNALIDAWLARRGRTRASFDAVERLCYTGSRGMGALEFEPAIGPGEQASKPLDVAALVQLASDVLRERSGWHGSEEMLQDILRVGTSAGGARAKAAIAWNPDTGEVRSGQVDLEEGFGHWLIKFDGVEGNKDKEAVDPRGYGTIEFAYANMAQAAGIAMSECRLLEENGRRHFVTKRFDRTDDGSKLHMQSLCALAHYDFNAAGAHSYEQALQVIRRLGLPMSAIEQQFRRMIFNVLARNQDDHVKNIAFLMDKRGRWSLSPAFDVTYAYNPDGAWTGSHQMSLNGKRDGFTLDDFRAVGQAASMKPGRAEALVAEVADAVDRWEAFAGDAGVPQDWVQQIRRTLRLPMI